MVATGQEIVRGKNSSRSGKYQGILFWVRENWHFEETSGKIDIVRLIYRTKRATVFTKPRFLTNF